ncbi:nickel insertion protein [Thermoproteota archaeon]
MKTLYFDLVGGISGDMINASLLDISKDIKYLKKELAKIKIDRYKLSCVQKQAGHIKALGFEVTDKAKKNRIFQYDEIRRRISSSSLAPRVRNRILSIYSKLLNAEKRAHRTNKVHFHQIGEVDSFLDIASACILIDKLGVSQVLYSSIPFGEKVAPATAYLIESKDIHFSGHDYENITPTGVAIVTTIGKQAPKSCKNKFRVEAVGYGAGTVTRSHDYTSNILRALLLKKK